jgi:hypothetical protein
MCACINLAEKHGVHTPPYGVTEGIIIRIPRGLAGSRGLQKLRLLSRHRTPSSCISSMLFNL